MKISYDWINFYTSYSIHFSHLGSPRSLVCTGLWKLSGKIIKSVSGKYLKSILLTTDGEQKCSGEALSDPLFFFCVKGLRGSLAVAFFRRHDFLDKLEAFSLLLERLSSVSGVRIECSLHPKGGESAMRSLTNVLLLITGWLIFKLLLYYYKLSKHSFITMIIDVVNLSYIIMQQTSYISVCNKK